MSRQDGPQLVIAHGLEYAAEAQDSFKYPAYDPWHMQPPVISSNPKSANTITSSSHDLNHTRKSDLPFAIPTWAFGMLAVLLGAVIGGSIVGGVLGSMLVNRPPLSDSPAAKDASVNTPPAAASPTPPSTTKDPITPSAASPTTAPTARLVNYAAPPRSDIESLSMPCPGMHQHSFRSFDDRLFSLQCEINNFGMGTDGNVIEDITAIMAYRWQDCFDACASHNKLLKGLPSHLVCRSAVYTMDINLPSVARQGGNCFLKNSTRHPSNPGVGNGINVFSADLELRLDEEA
ncbi:hypothetical protein PpBr36_06956 [Pyricularia pennisetigena]|uniref:hypothetical protein n=1 Tax=Pyricularia pennisetigena TaxID=1578925 RepID=UPI00115221C6|nr:hypothetical protein PpBr36_06956 [Pyricularia pennisetigena]TLS25596.1 hypothetical protein PpBr36_06956 [Pyricularia pennisetigena]